VCASVAIAAGACAPAAFDRPYPATTVEVPRDDAAHDAPIEWWYYVGHLDAVDGRRLGFQLTSFRALVPPVVRVGPVPLSWLVEQGHVAHAAITDLDAATFATAQRSDLDRWPGAASSDDLAVVPTGSAWGSPATGAVYPAGWRVIVPAFHLDVTVTPLVADQEMDTRATTGIVYREGAVDVSGSHPGRGYVELTNYDRLPFGLGGTVPVHDPADLAGPP
jgi:predicted secreted hydrolase